MGGRCDTPRRSRDARHVVGGTGDGGEASSRAQACMALTLIAWEGLGPTFRSTANAGDARLRSAAALRRPGSAGPQRPCRARGKRLAYRLSCRWELLASWPLLVSQGVTSRLLILCPAAADDVLGCHRPGSRCAAADKLAELRTAAYLYRAQALHVSSHGETSTGSAGRARATRRHVSCPCAIPVPVHIPAWEKG